MVLDDLDSADWASLTHAYGEAFDVPVLLRTLLSAESKVREETLYELFDNIWHQGTVYSASAAAVPFLYELLIAPEVQDKPAIADLLAHIATGVGYREIHAVGKFNEPTWSRMLETRGEKLEDAVALEAAETASVHRAASTGLRYLLSLPGRCRVSNSTRLMTGCGVVVSLGRPVGCDGPIAP